MPTAQVTLTDGWIHRHPTYDDYITFDIISLDETSAQEGEVRRYGSRRRSIIVDGAETRTITIITDLVPRATYNKLRGWKGQTVMFRDPMGRKVFGVFFDVVGKEQQIEDIDTMLWRLKIQIEEITETEEV